MPRDARSLFDTLEHEFDRLVLGPAGLALDGRAVGHGLPPRKMRLNELRSVLLRRSTSYEARDAALTELACRAQRDEAWMIGLAGVLLPGLRQTAGRLARGYQGDTTELDAEVLAGLIEAVQAFQPARGRVAARLLWTAYRHGERARRCERTYASRHAQAVASMEPPRPWGHPDLILTEAVIEGVLTVCEAELIGATRLDDVRLPDVAAELGVSADTLRHRRRRAERRLVAWIEVR